MPILLQIALLFVICVCGSVLSSLLPFPFPASVAAMALLFLLLLFRWVRPKQLEGISRFLQGNMAVLFVPPSVGVLACFELLRPYLWKMIVIAVLTTILTFGVTQFTVRLVVRLQNTVRKGGGKHGTAGKDL